MAGKRPGKARKGIKSERICFENRRSRICGFTVWISFAQLALQRGLCRPSLACTCAFLGCWKGSNEAVKKCRRRPLLAVFGGTSPLPTLPIVRCRSFYEADFSCHCCPMRVKRFFYSLNMSVNSDALRRSRAARSLGARRRLPSLGNNMHIWLASFGRPALLRIACVAEPHGTLRA